ncbi:hypothetical protein ABE65_008895 [Fictibacillus phosphorivorans]|uniref:Uncharacterized protein n=1 Tax=Fictibacillus phosphorivorans TaxID=1221500 RepID=A0A160IL63_9BACL|nr:hypothetical protein ABE65_008895 [Fictibacillus phosphorivorans]
MNTPPIWLQKDILHNGITPIFKTLYVNKHDHKLSINTIIFMSNSYVWGILKTLSPFLKKIPKNEKKPGSTPGFFV